LNFLLIHAPLADRVRAQTYGWPTATVGGTHLSIVTDPVGVSAAISRLAT